jgi:MoxR-like ATPase
MSEKRWRDEEDVKLAGELVRAREEIVGQVRKVIIGQERIVDDLLTALFCSGHCLLIGVPGLAKTLIVSTLARALELSFNRVQFTPDLMPSDITGTDILEEDASRHRSFRFIRGPVFTNVLLADEINRTPPKTQAALLQAMQEYQVTSGGQTYALERPFFVLATQNPIEQEGTYPLPEAQLDRFMFSIHIDYPRFEEEVQVVNSTTSVAAAEVTPVLDAPRILAFQELVRRVPAADDVVRKAVRLVQSSRPGGEGSPAFVNEKVSWGAGPRASQYLILGGKARALLSGRFAVSEEDILALAPAVLQHRILTNFAAEAEGVTTRDLIGRLLEHVPSHDK